MTNETLPDSWFNISAETKLENRIVSHHSVDVSEGNSLAVAAGKAVVIGSFRLYDEHQKTDCNFALENVPIKSNAPKYDVGIETHLQEFEARCNLTSNVSGHPDYALYKVLLDPTLSQEGSGIYNEYDVVRFSPTISTKFNNECYLATITLDNRCSILSQSCVGVDRRWKEVLSPTALLQAYLMQNENYFPGFKVDSASSKLDKLKELKYAASIDNLDWSDVCINSNEDGPVSEMYLATSTRNGFVIIWKFKSSDYGTPDLKIINVFESPFREISELKWSKNRGHRRSTDAYSTLCISSASGQISVSRFKSEGDNVTMVVERNVWNEDDNLVARHFHFINLDGGLSALLVAKSHILIVLKLDSNLEVCGQAVTIDDHVVPVVGMTVGNGVDNMEWYSCSSDGTAIKYDLNLTGDAVELENKEVLCTSAGIGGYRGVSPSMLHGISVSPNGAFLTIITSKPDTTMSIQVNNTSYMSVKRIMTPYHAATILRDAAFERQTADTFYYFLDVIELTRQHYFLTQHFDPTLQSFLDIEVDTIEEQPVKLQLRWHLLQIKLAAIRSSHINSRGPDEEFCNETKLLQDSIKEVEILLVMLQMLKVVQLWCENGTPLDSSVPIVQIVRWLENNKSKLSLANRNLIYQAKSFPAFLMLPVCPVCAITSQDLSLSVDGVTFSSADGSRWPACCCTFIPQQTYKKRRSNYSPLFAKTCKVNDDHWIKELLKSPCLFSGTPLT